MECYNFIIAHHNLAAAALDNNVHYGTLNFNPLNQKIKATEQIFARSFFIAYLHRVLKKIIAIGKSNFFHHGFPLFFAF